MNDLEKRNKEWDTIRQDIFDKFAYTILIDNKLPDDHDEIRLTSYLPMVVNGTKYSLTLATLVTEFYSVIKKPQSEYTSAIKNIAIRFGLEFKEDD